MNEAEAKALFDETLEQTVADVNEKLRRYPWLAGQRHATQRPGSLADSLRVALEADEPNHAREELFAMLKQLAARMRQSRSLETTPIEGMSRAAKMCIWLYKLYEEPAAQ